MSDSESQNSKDINPDPYSHLIIERMIDKDLDEILKIENESFTMPWSRYMFETEIKETVISYPWLARWKDDLNDEADKIDENKEYPICGYVIFWLVIDEIHIGNVAISSCFRRRGIASALIQHVLNFAENKGVKRITLEVRQSNETAIRLYQRFNFKEIALRKDYYGNPTEDAIVMVKDFKINGK